jgi:hypothetical protein
MYIYVHKYTYRVRESAKAILSPATRETRLLCGRKQPARRPLPMPLPVRMGVVVVVPLLVVVEVVVVDHRRASRPGTSSPCENQEGGVCDTMLYYHYVESRRVYLFMLVWLEAAEWRYMKQ